MESSLLLDGLDTRMQRLETQSRRPSQSALSFSHSLKSLRRASVPDHCTTRENSSDHGVLGDTGAPWSIVAEDSEINIESVEEVKNFNIAVSMARYIEAFRELEQLESAEIDPWEVLDRKLVERVKRITSHYEYSMVMLKKRVQDLSTHERNRALNLDWGVELINNAFYTVCEVEEPDLDVLRAFVAITERDLHKHWMPGVYDVQILSSATHENFCRSFSYVGTSAQADTITITSAVDALEETPFGFLWASHYTPPESAAVQGVEIPLCRKGFVRSERIFSAWMITPLRRGSNRTKGYLLKSIMEVELPGMVLGMTTLMPTFLLNAIARSQVEDISAKFTQYVKDSTELDDRMKTSPRAAFYEQIYQQLRGDPPRLDGI